MVLMTRKEARKRYGSGNLSRLECRLCGRVYVGSRMSKFCSEACFKQSMKRGVMDRCRNPSCNERFRAGEGELGFCSWDCYKADIPRRLAIVEQTRNAYLEKRALAGHAMPCEEDELRLHQSRAFLTASTEQGFFRRLLAVLARYEETVDYGHGITAYELGALLGLRFGERAMKVATVLERLEDETTFIIRVPADGVARWMLTEHGRREVIGHG